MILAVEIGNSNIVIGGVVEDEIRFKARLRTDATKTSDEYAIDLRRSPWKVPSLHPLCPRCSIL